MRCVDRSGVEIVYDMFPNTRSIHGCTWRQLFQLAAPSQVMHPSLLLLVLIVRSCFKHTIFGGLQKKQVSPVRIKLVA